MHDRTISLHHVSAAALWVVGAALVTIGLLAGIPGLGHIGLMAAGMGGVLNIRGFMCRALTDQRETFELGVEYAELKRVH
jgi:hypothetical protein